MTISRSCSISVITQNTWTLFSNASSAASRLAALALCLAALAGPARAAIDTEKVEDSVRLLRIAALSLKNDHDRGRAFTGLVGMQLKRDKLKASRIELKNIRDLLWRVRARILTSDYHLRKGRTKTARRTLAELVKLVPTKGRQRGADDTYLEIAIRQTDMGDFSAALSTAKRISVPLERLNAYLFVTDKAAANPDQKVATSARKMFGTAFALAKTLKGGIEETSDVLLRIAYAQIDAGHNKDALITLRHLHPLLLKSDFDGRVDRIANIAGGYVLAGDNNTAMVLVRSIRNIGHKAHALSAVASATGKKGNIGAAVPLFSLAFQETKRLGSEELRFNVIKHIVRHQSELRRYADAYKMAGFIRDRRMQALTMLAMGKAMMSINDHTNAERVTDYIPYIGMRSQIFTAIANVKGIAGESMEASALLAKGLADTPFKKINPESLEWALLKTTEIQRRVGAPEAAVSLFSRVRELAKRLPDLKPRVTILSQMAVALANIDQKQMAQDDLDVAWRLAWRDTNHKNFAEMLSNITDAQLAAGFVLQAFDTAARIPEDPAGVAQITSENIDATSPPETPRNRALRSVAMAAGRIGQSKLSIRAVRAISNETARAYAVANIAAVVADAENR
jgi:tetratricopeptide (TPR) repeat protein